MLNLLIRAADDEHEDLIRKGFDLSRRCDWFCFTCYVGGRRIVAYARENICPIRCDRFAVMLFTATRPDR